MTWLNNRIYQQELEDNCRLAISYEEFRDSGILVTGACGLIGSYLVDTFLKMNEIMNLNLKVTAFCHSLNRANRRFAEHLERTDFEVVAGDVGRAETLAGCRFRDSWDYMIHCAGNAHPRAFATQPVETMRANLLGTMHLLEEAVAREVRHPIRRLLFLSSGEIYGTSGISGLRGWTENMPGTVDSMNLRACYPEAKRAAETLCVSYAAEYGVPAVVARLCYVYGATMQDGNTRADVEFLSRAAAGRPVVLKSAGEQLRSYCYLQDAAAGLLFLLMKGADGEAYNISNSASNVTVREFAKTIAEIFQVPLTYEEPRAGEMRGCSTMKQELLDAGRLEALGWQPQRGLRDGITQVRDILRAEA